MEEVIRETGEEVQRRFHRKWLKHFGKKVRRWRHRSLRQSLYYYIPICVVMAFLGTWGIGIGTNRLQDWYTINYMNADGRIWQDGYEIFVDVNGFMHHTYVKTPFNTIEKSKGVQEITYDIISYAQVALVPSWLFACVGLVVWIFYKREIEKPLRVLQDASEKIADNCLDFEMEPVRDNELGRLRDGFEKMRAALYENNRATWQQLEERKRLNAAFAHDMRTPITVLKGYGEMLERYIPEGLISQNKLLEILGMMNGQIRRLENYTQKMSSIRKLEDMEPELAPVKASELNEKLRNMCEILGQDIVYGFGGEGILYLDETLVLEVCENLVSNGLRYARKMLQVTVKAQERERIEAGEETERYLEIVVEDDGPGFSPEELQHATDPFYRGEGQMEQSHFGLGLYICRLICTKCGGSLTLANGICGGRVTARFKIFPENP